MKSTRCTIFSVYFGNFIYNLYMFRTSPGPSSGGITLESCTPDSQLHRITKYQVSRKYSYSSWWWTWRGPKHIEVINKIVEIYWECCISSLFHLQDFPYFPSYKTHRDFFVRNFRKNNDECILILVIYWKKTGLWHTKISKHNIICSS